MEGQHIKAGDARRIIAILLGLALAVGVVLLINYNYQLAEPSIYSKESSREEQSSDRIEYTDTGRFEDIDGSQWNISKDIDDRFLLSRMNIDGSSGEYYLVKRDGFLHKMDRFGSKYKITAQGLELHDSEGHIRTLSRSNRTTPGTNNSYSSEPSSAGPYSICQAADRTGLLSRKCEVKLWGATINLTIDTTSTEARRICSGMIKLATGKGMDMNGWRINIYSPFSNDTTIAYCVF